MYNYIYNESGKYNGWWSLMTVELEQMHNKSKVTHSIYNIEQCISTKHLYEIRQIYISQPCIDLVKDFWNRKLLLIGHQGNFLNIIFQFVIKIGHLRIQVKKLGFDNFCIYIHVCHTSYRFITRWKAMTYLHLRIKFHSFYKWILWSLTT